MDWWPINYWVHFGVFALIIVILALIAGVMYFTWFERRVIGRFQIRLGPNRCGPFGLLQPIADGLKIALKEDIVPDKADKIVHSLAPIVAFLPVIAAMAVVPIHNSKAGVVPDLNIGALYVVAIGSLGGLGIFMAGWASNNKYSIFGAMRAFAQTVSYEMPVVLAMVSVVMMVGSMSMVDIVEAQSVPFILLQPLGFIIFFLAMAAECNRCPFDLLEAEGEIVAGFQTEYSGLKFCTFYLAEYGESFVMSALVATLFLGGWKPEIASSGVLGIFWFIAKVYMVFFLLIWIRATMPRLRVDQWMGFAWKGLFPLALINLLITAIEVVLFDSLIPGWMMFVNIPICIGLIVLWSKFFKLGGGRVEVPAIR